MRVELLIRKLEAAKGTTFGALADSTNYNYGIDTAIGIVRQYEEEGRQTPRISDEDALRIMKAHPPEMTYREVNGKQEISHREYKKAVTTMAAGLDGHMSIGYTAEELAMKALDALLERFEVTRHP